VGKRCDRTAVSITIGQAPGWLCQSPPLVPSVDRAPVPPNLGRNEDMKQKVLDVMDGKGKKAA
jgi:hypothetical protein